MPDTNGSTAYDVSLVLQSFRLLIADLCQQFGMGHPGSAIGMAAIGVALWKYSMRYAPHQPDWFNRDRFLLSNGHACLFQYANLYLSGYKQMTWEQLLSYHSERPDSLCPGHPEIEHEGIELTTGPLGQGIANAVGLAMATKHLAATFNRPGYEVVNNQTWCMVGDACLQEGVGCEAFSYAGHLKLNNLTVIYDNNQISCDGSVDLTNTEDVNKKMEACGWEVVDVEDGVNDVAAIVNALEKGRDPKREKPLFINIRTIIGVGSAVAGQAVAHGVPLGKDNVAEMKKAYGWDTSKTFHIPEKVKEFYGDLPSRGDQHVEKWNDLLASYTKAHPDLASTFKDRIAGKLPFNWSSMIPSTFPSDPTPSRKSNNLAISKILAECPTFMIGTADLTPSVNLTWPNYEIFNPPDLQPISGKKGSYAGRYIHFGIREHVMAAIANGLAAFNPGTIIPITSSFFMFYLYAAPAVRMGALQKLKVIHVATHDSIGAGEDGPTHQPVELAALYRAMPNMQYIRPGDSEEVAGAWKTAIEYTSGPSMISVSRHVLPQLSGLTKRSEVEKGAYVLKEEKDADVTLITVGAELSFGVKVAGQLAAADPPVKARLVSFPSHALFKQQSLSYQRSVLRRNEGIPAVVIEPYVSLGWERYADAGVNMKSYGHSLPGKYIYDYFGFNVEKMGKGIKKFVGDFKNGKIERGDFVDL
ncbi:dihydroxyacetone synthase [Setomelanomma holmii]|uniref:Dihydroxyacetone synthase n=1 Tax=Setomelanomma holmii TaxID=210430 RepID=A0A9P4H0W9_9PLEO|nr:dihydroxyacetone synthase [Setomelanomma holmii]